MAKTWQKVLVATVVFTQLGAPLIAVAGSSCTFSGQTIADGSSTTMYQAQAVTVGTTCASETRTCSNGVLSGSFLYSTCSASIPNYQAAAPPPGSGGGADPNMLMAAFGITAAMWLASQAIANAQCTEFKGPPPCKYQDTCVKNKPRTPENVGIMGKVCKDPRGVSGTCAMYNVCKASGVGGLGNGGANSGMNPLQMAMTLAQLLAMMNASNQNSGGANPTGPTGCTSFYQVATPTPQDPCAYYVPGYSNNISNGINTAFNDNTSNNATQSTSDLFNELYGDKTNVSTKFTDDITDLAGSSTIDISTVKTGATATTTKNGQLGYIPLIGGATGGLQPGVSGNVVITNSGATVFVTRSGTSSTVAGFYGSNAAGNGTQQTGLVAGWCQNRPWATNFLKYIIPGQFFDSLCTLRGFQVGLTPTQRAPSVEVTTTAPPPTSFTSTPVTTGSSSRPAYNGPKPQVDIWAIPPSVKLGSRTTIFWSAKNVASCQESSPDGSFTQNTLSGGAATVALSGPTTFTISCTALDGSHVADYVTVSVK